MTTTTAPTAGHTGPNARALARPPAPIRWRLALLNFFAVYPVITGLIYVIFPLTDGWTIWQRTLLLAPLMIGIMVYGIAPRIQRHFGWFIAGKPRG